VRKALYRGLKRATLKAWRGNAKSKTYSPLSSPAFAKATARQADHTEKGWLKRPRYRGLTPASSCFCKEYCL